MSLTFDLGGIGEDEDREKTEEVVQEVEHGFGGEGAVEDVAEDRGDPGVVLMGCATTSGMRVAEVHGEHELAVAQEGVLRAGPARALALAPLPELRIDVIDEGVRGTRRIGGLWDQGDGGVIWTSLASFDSSSERLAGW